MVKWNSFNWAYWLSYRELPNIDLGEYVDISPYTGSFSVLSGLVSLLALGIYAFFQDGEGNDDDDSDSGSGGLMQPIS